MIWHILPLNDLKEHTEEGAACECCPTVEILEDGDLMVMHNSYDGRELLERIEEELNNKDNA